MQSHSELLTGIAIVVAVPIVAALAISGGTKAMLAVGGLAAAAIGVYVGIRHPQWLAWGLAAALGFMPFGYFPGIHLPMYLPFAGGVVLAAIVHRGGPAVFHPLEKALIVFVLVSGVSLIFTGRTVVDVGEFIKWSVATLTVVALLRFPRDVLAKFGRIYVYFAALNGLFGIIVVAADPTHRFIKAFSAFGYGLVETGRFVYTDEGAQRFARLGGLWVDPNMAGVGLTIALAVGVLLLTGPLRVGVVTILSVAILLTLSRAAIFSVLVGVILVLLFHGMRARNRALVLGAMGAVAAGAMLTPAVRTRLFSSFSSDDVGSSARGDALRAFPGQMAGHWPFGLGWGRPEFKDGNTAFTLNFVANVPLITIYRAGLIVGFAFLVVLAIGCIMSSRAIRGDSGARALYGGIFIGVCLVALQLDHMVATIQQVTLMFSILLVFLVVVDQDQKSSRHAQTAAEEPVTNRSYSPLLR
ncbi:hypothetical protein MARA_24550 [Mycolicibacterium arabiense]|uniref:O-antigen polymerase n=1 Tax=Mycolicibacterium arabiense TaxID=1286181 RepID=A0A7I7RWP4_9MYCO|nr:hypothetical protein MARA_24550 [Mycolicibacterium arabiense]